MPPVDIHGANMKYNPHSLPVESTKVLVGFEPKKRQEFEFVDTVAIVEGESLGVVSMDRIRQDNGERVYFVGIGQGMDFIYCDKKYTVPVGVKE